MSEKCFVGLPRVVCRECLQEMYVYLHIEGDRKVLRFKETHGDACPQFKDYGREHDIDVSQLPEVPV